MRALAAFHGRPNLLSQAGFTPESTVAVMQRFRVTNFAEAPTMYRALSKSTVVEGVTLRRASSAGEPLTPDVVAWGERTFGTPVRDGSMGLPLPGFAAGVVDGQTTASSSPPVTTTSSWG